MLTIVPFLIVFQQEPRLVVVAFMNCFSFWLLGCACEHVRAARAEDATYMMVVKEVLPKPWDTIAGWACLLYPMGTSVSYVKLTHDSLFGIQGKAGFVPYLYHSVWLPQSFSQHKATTWLLLVSLFAVALAWLWSSRAQPKLCDLYLGSCRTFFAFLWIPGSNINTKDLFNSISTRTQVHCPLCRHRFYLRRVLGVIKCRRSCELVVARQGGHGLSKTGFRVTVPDK